MMNLEKQAAKTTGTRYSVRTDTGVEMGHAYLYLMYNDIHGKPFGFVEDVKIESAFEGAGHGSALVQTLIDEAKLAGCYKIICTARDSKQKTQEWYEKLGFKRHGAEFRIDL